MKWITCSLTVAAPTVAGGLYQVDLQLRPSGTAGPVAVSFAAFEAYHAAEAETWERLALCRARVVWATTPAFAFDASAAIEAILRQPRDARATAADVRAMRALIAAERPASGFWDLKLSRGGLVDLEFCAQYLQLVGAAAGGPLRANTGEAFDALIGADPARRAWLAPARRAWGLQQNLTQLLRIALDDGASPDDEPAAFKALLARAGGARSFSGLRARLEASRTAADRAFRALVTTRS